MASPTDLPDCVELGIWTPIPVPVPSSLRLKLKNVDMKASQTIKEMGAMTFHAVGCTGCHADQQATTQVAAALAVQAAHPHRFGGAAEALPSSFLYHLGDVVYRKDKDTAGEQSPPPPEKHQDFAQLYDNQFYAPYAAYPAPIFAIAGNHDGKNREPDGPTRKSGIHHFLKNFCGLDDGDPPDNNSSNRPRMAQPYPYWLLETPPAYFIGLYANVNNAGQLDNPEAAEQPQYEWLVRTLADIKEAADGKAVILAVHYPAYSAATTFRERGNPNLGPTPRPPGKTLEPLGSVLQRAFRDSRQYPDVALSAHAHNYQRLSYTYADGRQIPYLIVGGGGHIPVEKLAKPCVRTQVAESAGTRPDVVFPPGLSVPAGDRVELAAFNDTDFGFLRVTLDQKKRSLTGEYFKAFASNPSPNTSPSLVDSFTLDLNSHRVR
jgi:acid phosphatase type 7